MAARRFPKRLSLQCVSLLVGSVGRRFRTQLQCFRLSYIVRKMWMLIAGFPDEIWMLQQPEKKLSPSSPKKNNNFPSRPMKRQARQEFLFDKICTQTNPDPGPLASENSDQMIRFNLFYFLCGKKVQFRLSRKTTENSIQMVLAHGFAKVLTSSRPLTPVSSVEGIWRLLSQLANVSLRS